MSFFFFAPKRWQSRRLRDMKRVVHAQISPRRTRALSDKSLKMASRPTKTRRTPNTGRRTHEETRRLGGVDGKQPGDGCTKGLQSHSWVDHYYLWGLSWNFGCVERLHAWQESRLVRVVVQRHVRSTVMCASHVVVLTLEQVDLQDASSFLFRLSCCR